MSDPLIARRCPWCGVAIREQAFFCPQCGKDLTQLHPDFSATIVESAPPETKNTDTAELIQPAAAKESPVKAAPPEAAQAKARKAPIGQQALGKMGAGRPVYFVSRDVVFEQGDYVGVGCQVPGVGSDSFEFRVSSIQNSPPGT